MVSIMSKEKDNLNKKVSKIWGGRFSESSSSIMKKFNASISFDKRLCFHDLALSSAHSEMLAENKIITFAENKKIQKGLKTIEKEIRENKFLFSDDLEDIHMHIEFRLIALIGEAGKKLHTARSRNDQVVTTYKMYIRDQLVDLDYLLKSLQGSILNQAGQHINTIMPGFTHLQIAQPISLAHHLLAYVEMFGRDRERIVSTIKILNTSPLGAAALAGTSFPIDRNKTAKKLGFNKIMENSIDAVSHRDFVMDALSLASIIMMHLSRISEEIIFWASPGFDFVELPDTYSTGSSIMPQKKNPDAAELIRGKSGRVVGAFVSVFSMLKGLPLAYSKDMQEDKEPFFDAFDNLANCLKVLQGMIIDLKFKPNSMKKMLMLDYSTATDLADWLVKDCNIPFRDAHVIIGRIIKLAEKNNTLLEDLNYKELKNIDKRISRDFYKILTLEGSLKNKTSYGGTSPVQVRKALLKAQRKWLS